MMTKKSTTFSRLSKLSFSFLRCSIVGGQNVAYFSRDGNFALDLHAYRRLSQIYCEREILVSKLETSFFFQPTLLVLRLILTRYRGEKWGGETAYL